MATDALLVLVGVALLGVAGDRLIELASALAERARLTPAVIGLTVVAAGTSAPELFVSLTAAVRGSPDIALANVVGSNVANIGLVLGACAMVAAIPLDRRVLKLEYPFMLFASWIALLLCRDGTLDRLESVFFLAAVAAFMTYSVRVARLGAGPAEQDELAHLVPHHAGSLHRRPLWWLIAGLAVALVALGLGAHWLVEGATGVARRLGVSDRTIGLTVVAVGTSLPELAATLAAAFKRQHEMAVTNVVGSNILNLFLILGATGAIRPVPVAPELVQLDMWVMLGFAVVPFPVILSRGRLSRWDGALLLTAYAAYVTLVVAT